MCQSPVKIVLTLQESPNEDLDVARAFAKQPDLVREVLFEAICQVQLRSTDITLLRIENAFRSTLKKPWKESRILRPVLDACRQGKLESRTENLFFEHGEEYGVVALCAATAPDGHTLMREIDLLQDDDLVRLIKIVGNIPKRAAIVEFIEEFAQTLKGIVSDPPPRLSRPRTRKKDVLPTGESPSPSHQVTDPATLAVHQSNKKRRLNRQVHQAEDPRALIQNSPLPLPPEIEFSGMNHQLPYTTSTLLPIPRTLPVQQNYPLFSHQMRSDFYLPQLDILNPNPHRREDMALQDVTGSLQSRYTTLLTNFKAGERLQYLSDGPPVFDGQTSQMPGQGEEWDYILGREFIPGRPPSFDGQTSQITGQGEDWDYILGREFIPGRPPIFDGQTLQMSERGDEWHYIPGREFISGRPPVFDGQTSQLLGQGEEWDYILGRDFVPGRPHMQYSREPRVVQDEFRDL